MITKILTKPLLLFVAVLCALFFLFGLANVVAARTDRPPVVDGILNDSAWTKSLETLMSRYHELGEFNGAVLRYSYAQLAWRRGMARKTGLNLLEILWQKYHGPTGVCD